MGARREPGRKAGTDFQGCQAPRARTLLRPRGGDRGSHHPSPPPPGADSRLARWTPLDLAVLGPTTPRGVPCGLEAADPGRSLAASPPRGRRSRICRQGRGRRAGGGGGTPPLPRPELARGPGAASSPSASSQVQRWVTRGPSEEQTRPGGNPSVGRQRSWRAAPSWMPREAEERARCGCCRSPQAGLADRRTDWLFSSKCLPGEAPGLWGLTVEAWAQLGRPGGLPGDREAELRSEQQEVKQRLRGKV